MAFGFSEFVKNTRTGSRTRSYFKRTFRGLINLQKLLVPSQWTFRKNYFFFYWQICSRWSSTYDIVFTSIQNRFCSRRYENFHRCILRYSNEQPEIKKKIVRQTAVVRESGNRGLFFFLNVPRRQR